METISFEAPALYGDHHVSEVRRILLEMTGVKDVYVSSAFRTIEVAFDPATINASQIEACLQEAGYLGEIPMLVETGIPVEKVGFDTTFRHTEVYETLKQTVTFSQRVQYQGRPLWPCPGFGAVKMRDEQ